MSTSRPLTKLQIGRAMMRIERDPSDVNLNAGAQLLGFTVEPGEDGTLLYRGGVYPDRAALQDELLVDLGSKKRSL